MRVLRILSQNCDKLSRFCRGGILISRLLILLRLIVYLCYFTGFNFGFEELEDIDCSLIIESAFGVVELGKGGG